MRSNLERSRYYKFIQGDLPLAEIDEYKKKLNFLDCYKYKDSTEAHRTITAICSKLKSSTTSAEMFQTFFEVRDFEDIPFEYVELHKPVKNVAIKVISKKDSSKNWQSVSRDYCSNCGIFIPAQQMRACIGYTNICRQCIKDIETALEKDDSLTEDQLKQLETARVVGMF